MSEEPTETDFESAPPGIESERAAFAEAERRIAAARASNAQQLDLSGLRRLTALPGGIERLGILGLNINRTSVGDITPLAALNQLETLDLDDTPVAELRPVSSLVRLRRLNASRTLVSDISPLAPLAELRLLWLDSILATDFLALGNFPMLESLSLGETRLQSLDLLPFTRIRALYIEDTLVSDLTPLAGHSTLHILWIDSCPISDLSALTRATNLMKLRIAGTQVTDLSPLAAITTLQDEAVNSSTYGLDFAGTPISRQPPFDTLVELPQPARTVETLNAVRRSLGIAPYFPPDYQRPSSATEQTDGLDIDPAQLNQKPASHSFGFRHGRIEAQTQVIEPRHGDVAGDIRDEVAAKAGELAGRLVKVNAPPRVASTIARLRAALGSSLEEVRAGILQMRFRSLEADIAAYDTEEGRQELPEDALAMLRDLMSSVEDLMGCFPQLAEIEAERLAQRLQEADVPAVVVALEQIRDAAEGNAGVAPSAVEALRTGEPELAHDAEIIDGGLSDVAKAAARLARDRTVGYMLLVHRNFVASAVKVGSEMAGFGADTWQEFRHDAPKRVSEAAIALLIAGLVSSLLGPVAAVGAFAASFKPLRDKGQAVVAKLAAAAKRTKPTEPDATGSATDPTPADPAAGDDEA